MDYNRFFKVLIWNLISALPAREMTLETRNGNLTFNTKDYVLGKHLYVDRSYEIDSIENVLSIVAEMGRCLDGASSVFIDVGANIGTISVALMRSGLFKRGLAFEPEPYNFSLLKKNVEQNRLQDTVDCYNQALSSEEALRDLELATDNFGDHRLRIGEASTPGHFKEEGRKTVTVPMKPLDHVINTVLRRDVSLIWLDIQGHEGYFLKGAQETILEARPVLFMEFWPYGIKRSGFSREEYCSLVSSLFSNYMNLTGDRRGPVESTESFGKWFDQYPRPREMGVFLLF